MKALTIFKSALDQSSLVGVLALALLTPLLFPQLVSAAALQTQGQSPALIFEIKSSDTQNTQTQTNNGTSSLSYDQVVKQDPEYLALKTYLNNHNSPLADYTAQLLQKDNWKTIIAISFVESNMCVHNYYHNCSGIGGQEYLRKYSDFGGWINDMSQILDQRYQGWTLDQMDGVYVQPRSSNWANGSKKILAELNALQQQANQESSALAINAAQANQPVATFPELAINTQ